MKSSIIFLTVLAISCITFSTMAQSNDPSYSTNNYKHPNKVKVAQAKSKNQGVSTQSLNTNNVEEASLQKNMQGNYKAPRLGSNRNNSSQGLVVLPNTSLNDGQINNGNYKQQNRLSKPKNFKKPETTKPTEQKEDVINR
jgi:hypothetical protein